MSREGREKKGRERSRKETHTVSNQGGREGRARTRLRMREERETERRGKDIKKRETKKKNDGS